VNNGNVITGGAQASGSEYGPNNWYDSGTFIVGKDDWSNPLNNNLR
jgi:hypothetical protein